MRRLPALVRRARVTVLLEGGLALVAMAVVLVVPGDAHGTATAELSQAAGTLSLGNSRAGAAIFQAANLRPGQQARGSVRVTNTGTLGATLSVARDAPRATGAAGALLVSRLQLTIYDVTDAARTSVVYAGPLGTMSTVRLGALAAGRARDFIFVAALPAGVGDNLLQGTTMAAGFTWTATASAPPVVTPTPTPAPPVPTPTPAPTVTPPPPPASSCKPRKVRIRIPAHGRKILTVTVKIGHGHAKRVKPKARFKVTVKGAKPRKVRVVATLAGGTRVTVKKRVRGC